MFFEFGGSAPGHLYGLDTDQTERYLLPTIAGDRVTSFMLSEPDVGSDATNLRTTAVRDADDWVINGEKTWISFGSVADHGIVFCRTRENGDDGISAFLVDRDAGWTSSPIPVMGGYDVATISFVDVRVSDANRVGPVNKGFSLAMDSVYRTRAVLLPARQIGACERLLGMAIEYAKNRVTMGKPLSARANIGIAIAEAEIALRSAKLMLFHGAWLGDTGRDVRQASCVTKVQAARVANELVDQVLQIHGAIGYSRELPIERFYRDLRVARIWEGADEINLLTIARNLFRGYATVADIW